jgi:hypothetical protein
MLSPSPRRPDAEDSTWPEEALQRKRCAAINLVSLSTAPATRAPACTRGLADTRARAADTANAAGAITIDPGDTTGTTATVETAQRTATARTNTVDATDTTPAVETADVGIITGPLSKCGHRVGDICRAHSQ